MPSLRRSPNVPIALVLILLISLAGRLAWGLSRSTDAAAIDLLPDQRGYLDLAHHLSAGEGLHYVDPRFGPMAEGKPVGQTVYAARTPGYPMFVALCGGSVRAVRVVQSILDCSTALAIYLLSCRFRLPKLACVFAAGLVAFNPFLLYFSALLLTETLFTALLAWAMVFFLQRRGWAWGALLLAIAFYVRPSGIGLGVALAAVSVACGGSLSDEPSLSRKFDWFRAIRRVIVAGAITVAALLPWAWRNHQVLGRAVWSTSNDGITAYDGFHPGATGGTDQASFLKLMPQVRAMGELERSDYLAAEARRFVLENPREVVRLTLIKLARTWSPIPLSEDFGRPLYRIVAAAFAVPFFVLVLVGVFAGRLGRGAVTFLLLPAIYFSIIHAMSVGSLRYRIPVEPPLAILAAAGAACLGSRASAVRAKRRLAGA